MQSAHQGVQAFNSHALAQSPICCYYDDIIVLTDVVAGFWVPQLKQSSLAPTDQQWSDGGGEGGQGGDGVALRVGTIHCLCVCVWGGGGVYL